MRQTALPAIERERRKNGGQGRPPPHGAVIFSARQVKPVAVNQPAGCVGQAGNPVTRPIDPVQVPLLLFLQSCGTRFTAVPQNNPAGPRTIQQISLPYSELVYRRSRLNPASGDVAARQHLTSNSTKDPSPHFVRWMNISGAITGARTTVLTPNACPSINPIG